MGRIIQPGDPAAASFNDDSSPDTRVTAGQKLSVSAQVLPESSLDWYYRILLVCESIPGELKSADVWVRFQALHGENKDRIWAGLSKVRIHVVDPRPYRKEFDDVIRKVVRCDDPATFLRQQIAVKDPLAIWLSIRGQFFMAEQILDDSIGARVHSLSRYLSERSSSDGPVMDDVVVDLREFGRDVKPLVRNVTAWAAKSAATFHEALDCFLNFDEGARFFQTDIIKKRMKARILNTHVFDEGNQKQVDLLERARGNILTNLTEPVPDESAFETRIETTPYSQVKSTDSFLVQAADIAAGIASKLLETQGLVAVVGSFEYVTYNGRRLSITDAEEETRRMEYP